MRPGKRTGGISGRRGRKTAIVRNEFCRGEAAGRVQPGLRPFAFTAASGRRRSASPIGRYSFLVFIEERKYNGDVGDAVDKGFKNKRGKDDENK